MADVDVWFALALEEHQHRNDSRRWWEKTPGLAFVRVTRLGLLRLLTSSGPIRGQPLTNQQAWAVYDAFFPMTEFACWPTFDEPFRDLSPASRPPPKIWADAYIAAQDRVNPAGW